MAWRLAVSLDRLRAEVNARWPNRSKASDGTIGDAAHASRKSDHNPWVTDANGVGVVRALDITADGINPRWYADHVRQLGANGDRRLNPAGYVIYAGQIASAQRGWGWRPYTGANSHHHHVHVSVTTEAPAYDAPGPWGVSGSAHPPEPAPAPPKPTGELTMDAEAKAAFAALNRRLDGLAGGQSVGIKNQGKGSASLDSIAKQIGSVGSAVNKLIVLVNDRLPAKK